MMATLKKINDVIIILDKDQQTLSFIINNKKYTYKFTETIIKVVWDLFI